MHTYVSPDSTGFPAGKKTIILGAAAIVAIALLAFGAAQADAAGTTYTVDDESGHGDYDAIQAAIDNADENDTIKVEPGEYRESLEVNKSLKIVGDPVIDAQGSEYGIHVKANDTLLQNYTFYNYTTAGIYVQNDTCRLHNVTIDNCTVTNSTYNVGAYGIRFDGVTDSWINNSVARNHTADTARGIYIEDSDYNKLTNNRVHKNSYGIGLERAKYNDICNNKVYRNSHTGINAADSTDNDILLNEIYKNSNIGIHITYSPEVNITANLVENNEHGILLDPSDQDNIQSNTIKNNYDVGISLDTSEGNRVANNTLSNPNFDLSVTGSPDNVFSNNTFSSYPTAASFTYSGGFQVSGVDDPPAVPADVVNISKFLDITGTCSWLNVTFHYRDSDLQTAGRSFPADEAGMTIWKHDGSWDSSDTWCAGRGVNPAANEIWANITSIGSVFAPLQDTYNYTLDLYHNGTGVNYVSMPPIDSGIDRASDLVAHINQFSAGVCSYVSYWDKDDQRYYSYVPGSGGSDFAVEPGRGYVVWVKSNVSVSIRGPLLRPDVDIPLRDGYSLVGWTAAENAKADAVADAVSRCVKISKYNASSQRWLPEYVDGIPVSANFQITMDDAVFVFRADASTVADWHGGTGKS